jgi:hemolysin III
VIGGVRHQRLSTALYLAIGWLILAAAKPLLRALLECGLFWLAAGGIAFTAGVRFYSAGRLRYAHFVWHHSFSRAPRATSVLCSYARPNANV